MNEQTDGQTNEWTLVIVVSLPRLKTIKFTAKRGCEVCQEVLTWMFPEDEPELMAQSKYKDIVQFTSAFLHWNVVDDCTKHCRHCTAGAW